MRCNTIRDGIECTMMRKDGCSVIDDKLCHIIVAKCFGCQNIIEYGGNKYCILYSNPDIKWKSDNCNAATHIKKEMAKDKPKINPMKAAKRAMKGR